MNRSGLEQLLSELGEKPYHGRQIYKWIYKNRISDFDQMTDLRKDLRVCLDEKFGVRLPVIKDRQLSADGTEKFLLAGYDPGLNGKLDEENLFESVLIKDPESERATLCISSQAGCALKCQFCATGQIGFGRNLTTGEIIGQPIVIRKMYGDDAFDNLVFMGMGEPLLNYENVMGAIDIMTDSNGLMLGAKKITISTAGIVSGIRRLAKSGSKANLALSLNAADDTLRGRLMPIARSYPLEEVMVAVKEWTSVRKRRVTFEYILFKGINDCEADALALANLIQGIPCKINLLAYNPIDAPGFVRPSDEEVDLFAKILYPRAPAVTVRKSRGSDIDAACGQLAGKKGYQ